MKKILSAVLVLALSLSVLCMTALALEESDVLGTWYLNAIEMNGTSMSPAAMGMEMAITFKEGGIATMSMSGEEADEGTWKIENDMVIADNDMSLAFVDGTLVVEQDGMKMVFAQEKAEAETVEIAPVRNATDLAEFDGEWIATIVETEGAQLPLGMLGMEMKLSISAGAVKISVDEAMELGDAPEMQGELKDGALVVSFAAFGTEAVEQTLLLHENDMISFVVDVMGAIYFERV